MRRVIQRMEQEAGDALRAAAVAPTTFAEGLVAYLEKRQSQLEADYAPAANKFEMDRITDRINALGRIAEAGGAVAPDKKHRRRKGARVGNTGEDNLLHLAVVLTPTGWEESILPQFEELRDAALAGLRKKEKQEENQALLIEVQKFVTHLRLVGDNAEKAKAKIARRVVNG